MENYICTVCGYEYNQETGDPESDIEPGSAFADLPEDWVCQLVVLAKTSLKQNRNS